MVVIDLSFTLDTIGLEESNGGVDDGVEDVLLTSGSVVSPTTFVVSLNLTVESVEPTSAIPSAVLVPDPTLYHKRDHNPQWESWAFLSCWVLELHLGLHRHGRRWSCCC